jgi:hypothetical protein
MNKKLLLSILFVCTYCFSFLEKSVHAQSVPVLNGGFENWSSKPMFEVPDVCPPTNYFDNSNYRAFADANVLNMTKITRGGGKAMRLETITYSKGLVEIDTTPGYAIWGTPPQGQGALLFKGGFPFTDKNLTGISVDLRYSINVASTGLIFVQFKKNGVPIDGGNAPLSQSGIFAFPVVGNQATFTTQTFSIPGLSIVPDTCVVAFISGNPSGLQYPGDYIEVDNIAFTGTSQVVPGGNLDSWVMLPPVEAVDNWNFEDDQNNANVFRTTDKNSGNYAIQLRTIDWGGGGNNMQTQRAILGKTIYGQNTNTNIPGMAVTGRPQSFGFYYKYSTLATDSASVYVKLTKWNGTSRDDVGSVYIYMLPSGSYVYKNAVVNYQNGTVPDSAYIEFGASKNWPGKDGSLLKVDDVIFNYCNEVLAITGSASVCASATGVTYSVVSSPGASYSWTVPAGASIASGTGTNKITVDFGPTGGTVSVTKSYVDGCTPTIANLVVGIQTSATANANADQNICANTSATLNGSVTGAGGGTWSGGAGTFSPNANTLNATYTPSTGEKAGGSATLTLTTTGNGGCSSSSDNIIISISAAPTANANADQTKCANNAAITLAGSVTGATGQSWSGGAGSYAPNANTLTATYTPTAGEIASGSLTLTLTATKATCNNVTDQMIIAFSAAPTANAGGDQTVCASSPNVTLAGSVTGATSQSWSSSGTGTFSPNSTALNATYTPSAADIVAGSVTLTCSGIKAGCTTVTDQMLITISTCTGIANASVRAFNIYPSPANSVVNIEAKGITVIKDITVLNALQQTEEVKIMELNGGVAKLDVTNLSPGIYFIRISDGNAVTVQKITIE